MGGQGQSLWAWTGYLGSGSREDTQSNGFLPTEAFQYFNTAMALCIQCDVETLQSWFEIYGTPQKGQSWRTSDNQSTDNATEGIKKWE